MAARKDIVSLQRIERVILMVRGQKVLLDRDLAVLYGVETRVLNQAVRRNIKRFPADFMVKLSRQEIASISQFVISSGPLKFSKSVHAFTEQGVAMLSSVLNSPRAIRVNIEIMRAFVLLRQMLATNADLARRLGELEKKYDSQFKIVFEAIRQLMAGPDDDKSKERREIGFHTLHESEDAVPPPRKPKRVRY
ncbi:MAG TPA: ORF6N domain-containing protein [Candidatus Limnocylindria bacterium]|nr:ORF6N domain-containing protein [Candidatus Limnocylindria bacterium]